MAFNGFPFDESLVPVLDSVKDRIKLNKAAMIIIDGGVGEGKTTFACQIANYFQKDWVKDRAVELLAMGGSEFTKALDVAVKKNDKVVVYDEAGDFSSRSALTFFNQNMNRIFETYRQTQKIIILCLPFFVDVDKSIFMKKIPRFIINCHGRTQKLGRYRVYSLWRSWYLRKKTKELTVPQMCYSLVTPNLRGAFKDLESDEAEIIANISIKGKRRIIQESYLLQKGLVDVDTICRRTGYSRNSVYGKLKDVEFEKVGNKKYFSKSILADLEAQAAKSIHLKR